MSLCLNENKSLTVYFLIDYSFSLKSRFLFLRIFEGLSGAIFSSSPEGYPLPLVTASRFFNSLINYCLLKSLSKFAQHLVAFILNRYNILWYCIKSWKLCRCLLLDLLYMKLAILSPSFFMIQCCKRSGRISERERFRH